MRLFIAVPFPEKIQDHIDQKTSDLKRSHPSIRWISHENLHLTLKFLGEVPAEKTFQIQECMLKVVERGRFNPFEINLIGVGVFPDPDHPRVIWIGVTQGQEVLSRLAKDLEDELEPFGFQKEERSYRPHLTIGRAREPKDVKGFKAKVLAFEKTSFASLSVSMISLMQSVLNPKGAVYTTVHQVRLV